MRKAEVEKNCIASRMIDLTTINFRMTTTGCLFSHVFVLQAESSFSKAKVC